MLLYQLRTFRRFLRPTPLFVVIVDTADASLRSEFERVCTAHAARCLHTPAHEWASQGGPSWLHGQALDWAWEEVLLPRYPNSLLFITEQDVFLLGPFDVRDALNPHRFGSSSDDSEFRGACARRCSMGGVSQVRRNQDGWEVEYLHPSAILLDMGRLPIPQAARFSPIEFNGTELDTGGSLAMYWEAAREVEEEAAEEGGGGEVCVRVCRLAHRYAAADTCFWEVRADMGLPDVYDDVLLHAQRSSAWDIRSLRQAGRDPEKEERLRKAHAQRMECLWTTLDDALAV